jgi:MOSC domain-containing protein YiiM
MIDSPRALGRVVSVNVGPVRTLTDGKRAFTSAIGKRAKTGRLAVAGDHIVGDEIADPGAHGGADRAVYAYAAEDYGWWENELGRPLAHGLFGENLTTQGIDVSGALIGETWRVGNALLRVTSIRVPCYKLAHVVGESDFVKRFAHAHRPGAYLAIETEGDVGADDTIAVTSRPADGLSLADFSRIYFEERERVREILTAPHVTVAWRDWAEREAEAR